MFWDDTASCSIRWSVSHHLLPLSCQFSHYCSCAWAIRHLAVEEAIRRRIRQCRHGYGYARSATMTGWISDTCFLEPMEEVTRSKHKSLKERTKTGHHNVPRRNVKKSQESCPVPVSVLSVNTSRQERESQSTVNQLTVQARRQSQPLDQSIFSVPIVAKRECDSGSSCAKHPRRLECSVRGICGGASYRDGCACCCAAGMSDRVHLRH